MPTSKFVCQNNNVRCVSCNAMNSVEGNEKPWKLSILGEREKHNVCEVSKNRRLDGDDFLHQGVKYYFYN